MTVWSVAIIVFLLNIPFGYWRARTKRFSKEWVLAVHLPVPAVIGLRFFSGLGWRLAAFPILFGAFFCGQFAGGRLQRLIEHLN